MKLRREKAKAKRVKDALKKKELAAGASGSSPEKVEVKTPKPTSDSAKTSKMDKLKKKKNSGELPKVVSPPTKKRKIEEPIEESGLSTATEEIVSVLPKKMKKSKLGKADSNDPPLTSPDMDVAVGKESVKAVARSISDRAQNARQRAMSTSKSKDDSRPRKKKPVAAS